MMSETGADRQSLLLRTKLALLNIPVRGLSGHKYDYMFSPAQLGFLCEQLTRTADVPGSIVEIGCAYGATTVFLNRHLDSQASTADYFAIDTFRGFTEADISAEKKLGRDFHYEYEFRQNSKAAFDRTMRRNGIDRVTSFRADAGSFDYASIAPFRFALVDVDLYKPVLSVLRSVYALMSPGGVIVTDDCSTSAQDGMWAGAYHAFTEFTQGSGLESVVVHEKLGVIVKPRSVP